MNKTKFEYRRQTCVSVVRKGIHVCRNDGIVTSVYFLVVVQAGRPFARTTSTGFSHSIYMVYVSLVFPFSK